MIDGAATEVRTIAVETLREPVTEHLMTGTKLKDFMYGSINGVDFIWPVPQYRYLSRWMGGQPYRHRHRRTGGYADCRRSRRRRNDRLSLERYRYARRLEQLWQLCGDRP